MWERFCGLLIGAFPARRKYFISGSSVRNFRTWRRKWLFRMRMMASLHDWFLCLFIFYLSLVDSVVFVKAFVNRVSTPPGPSKTRVTSLNRSKSSNFIDIGLEKIHKIAEWIAIQLEFIRNFSMDIRGCKKFHKSKSRPQWPCPCETERLQTVITSINFHNFSV